ncbi:uncharacterized protein LOC111045345 isoform X2 [Nilaparvata lugens]|uniref:uncharacterized protein LOC120355526 isoform X1 n=1 Tax=Nilaparvata lugens TaxID=108931 RepID=UPI00193E9D0F|nr:uncharacterized protein LOC120355526 isoform X1 [Nilaparvata lugens]XP_039300219.1 uncharacterized protein LOC111045345 isoform X2 [Nilaparvata lugens]
MSLYLALSISEEEEEEEGTFSPAELAESLSSLKPHQVMVIGSVVLNQIVVGLAVSYLSVLMCGIGVLMAWRGFSPLRQLPTFHWVCAELALHITLTEFCTAACFISTFTSSTTSGRLQSQLPPSTVIPSSTHSAICCRPSSG